MPIPMPVFSELVMRNIDPWNQAACRHLADEGRRGRHDARRAGPPFVSETLLRHRALQQEAAAMHLIQSARRERQNVPPERAKRRRSRIVHLLRRAWRLVGGLRTA
jgi:hypothetical protein